MIEGGKLSWFDSLEELFILQNIADLKVIKYKVFIFNFGFKISGDLTKPGWFFLFFGFTHHDSSTFVNVALSYERDWRASISQWTKNGGKEFYKFVMSFHIP